jgi:hypothetical protein
MIAPNIREFILLTQLQNMNDEQMNTHISQVLKKSMDLLQATICSRKKTKNLSETGVMNLNERRQPPQSVWQGDARFDPPPVIVEDLSNKLETKLNGKVKDTTKWKGKTKANVRRNIALASDNDFL